MPLDIVSDPDTSHLRSSAFLRRPIHVNYAALGSIGESPCNETKLPGELIHGNPVFDLNGDNPDNDGLGFVHEGE